MIDRFYCCNIPAAFLLMLQEVVTLLALVTAKTKDGSNSSDKSGTQSSETNSGRKSSGNKSGSQSLSNNERSKSSGNKSGSQSLSNNERSKSSGSKSGQTQSRNKRGSSSSGDLKQGCTKHGQLFALGSFTDPGDSCNVCECFVNGKYECIRRTCKPANCGQNLQKLAEDGCCMTCDQKCRTVSCKRLSCAKKNQLYRDDSCCPGCGCKYKGQLVPEGAVGDRCDRCNCMNGDVKCNPPSCPRQKLQCVDPTRDRNCKPVCPTGKNCMVGNVIIKYGEYKKVGDKLCTCAGDWFPNAFCKRKPKNMSVNKGKNCMVGKVVIKNGEYKKEGKKLCTCVGDWFCADIKIPKRIKELQKSICVAEISNYANWKK